MRPHRRHPANTIAAARVGSALALPMLLALFLLCEASPCAAGASRDAAVPMPAPAQPISDALLRTAVMAVEAGAYPYAERLLDKVDLAWPQADAWTRGEVLRCRGLIALESGKYPEAGAALRGAEDAFQEVRAAGKLALTWRHRAILALRDGDRPAARRLAERAMAAFESQGERAELVATMTVLASLLERDEGGPELLERAMALAEREGLPRQLARLLHLHGDWRFVEGDFAGAVRSYERSEAIYLELGNDDGLGRVWTSLGRMNRAHGRHELALGYYRRALGALERAGDREGVVQANNAIATALANLGRPEEARAAYEQALSMAERLGAARLINFQRGNLGGHYLERRDFARAIPLLRESAAQESNDTTRAIRQSQLGSALVGNGQQAEALALLGEAIEHFRRFNNRERLFGAYAGRAEAYRQLGRKDEALADVRLSLEVLEQVRGHLAPGDFLRRGFHQYTQTYASLGIRILSEADRPKEALEAAEQARARAFLDLLAARPALATVATPERLLLKMDRPPQGQAAAPEVAAVSQPAPVTSFERIVAEARARRSSILNYWVDATRTHVWLVRPDGQMFHATVETTDRALVDLVRAIWAGLPQALPHESATALSRLAPLSRAASEPPANDVAPLAGSSDPISPRRAARELYRLLIAPIEAHLPPTGATLTIVPHGPLFRLSFAALLDPADRYLVERYATAYGPSVSVLAFTRETAARRVSRSASYLFVADPSPVPSAPGDPEPLPPLPGTLDEVKSIVGLLPASSTVSLTGSAATELAVTRSIPAASVIHFATHGIVRDDDPFGSFLALGADGIGAGHDGALTAEEIYGLPLQARLVVLSACRSGLGEVTADGIVGLTRAFFFAGTPSVVATLWDVADGPSARLLRSFYDALSREGNTARALRAAQRDMLAQLRGGLVRQGVTGSRLPERPVFWAAFVLIGEP